VRASGNFDGLRKFRQVIAEEDDVGALAGDVSSGSHRHAHSRLDQRRRVIHVVADRGD